MNDSDIAKEIVERSTSDAPKAEPPTVFVFDLYCSVCDALIGGITGTRVDVDGLILCPEHLEKISRTP